MIELSHDVDTAAHTGQSMAICFVDVDAFKTVNDTYGHAAGDDVLRRVAETVREHLRGEDILVRYGGDEFVVGALGLDVPTALSRLRAVDARLRSTDNVSISFGVSLVAASSSVGAVIERADRDLYRRRAAHRARPERGTKSHRVVTAPDENVLAADTGAYIVPPLVDAAIESVLDDPQSVTSVYQPIVDLATATVVGFEALARWPHLPAVDPSAVFDTAAARGVLPELDWASRLAAVEGALNAGMTRHQHLFVNVEPHALDATPQYARELVRAATEQLSIVVELTERSLLSDPGMLLPQIDQARADGCIIALDDVGANPDSLTMLEFVAPDIIKLDRTLVQHDPAPQQAITIAAIRAHVDAAGAVLLAEGIETADDLERARAYGCSLGQGWLFGRPSPLPHDVAATDGSRYGNVPVRWCRVGGSPGHVPPLPSGVFGDALTTIGRKSLLIALTRQIEEQAATCTEPLTILSSFQRAEHFTATIAGRYEKLAAAHPLVAVLGVGMGGEPAPGVRGTSVQPDDALADEWVITVVGHHHFAALIARDLGDTGADIDHRFEFLHTFDRNIVINAARSLMQCMLPAQPRTISTPSEVSDALHMVRTHTG